jgi:hypothetical protein
MELPDLLFEHGHIVEKSEFDSVWATQWGDDREDKGVELTFEFSDLDDVNGHASSLAQQLPDLPVRANC